MRASPNQLAPSRSVESAGRAETGTGLTGALKGTFLSGLEGAARKSQKLWFHLQSGLRSDISKLAVWSRNAQTASRTYAVYLTGHGQRHAGRPHCRSRHPPCAIYTRVYGLLGLLLVTATACGW